MKTYSVPMASVENGTFTYKCVAASESSAAVRAIQLNPGARIIGRIVAA